MAKFHMDPSSVSSTMNGDASPHNPPTLQEQGDTFCRNCFCTKCVKHRHISDGWSDFNPNAKFGTLGQPKSDKPDSKLDAPDARFETRFAASPGNPPTELSAPCKRCPLFSCICPKNKKPDSKSDATAARFDASPCIPPTELSAPCKRCPLFSCICPRNKKPDSKSDATAARFDASPCIPLTQRLFRWCSKCETVTCPNATTTVGPPPCLTCRKPGCFGGLTKPGSLLHPHSLPKGDSVPKPGSLFTSGLPDSHGLLKGDKPGPKVEALDVSFDGINAKLDAMHDALNSLSDDMGSKFGALIRHLVENLAKTPKGFGI
ncbi:unnamed protein product [Clonostachys solani]|uniref:Uncharacterized protein n=1 Tax=Clonostachys solani TaxID=160281 RepID=A0A9N9Z4H6_9HYPO|nr:unnamed protein product [Clonostachys solani]